MKRLRLLIIVILIVPALFLSWLTATESGLNWAYQRVEFYLPFELNLNKLEGRLVGPVIVKNFEYEIDGTRFNAGQITLDWQPSALLVANINISQFHIQSLNIVLPKTDKTESAQPLSAHKPIELPEISLPWRLLLKNAEVDKLSISQNDQVFNLLKVKLNATTLFSKINIKQLSIVADTFSLDIKGKLQPTKDYLHDLDINWQLTLPSSEILMGKGQLVGNMQSTRIKQSLNGPVQLKLDARLNDLLNQLNWTAQTHISKFDIAKLETSWPALSGQANVNAEGTLNTATLSGDLKGKYPELGPLDADFKLRWLNNDTVQIDQLQLRAAENSTQLNASGRWQAGEDHFDLALNWQNLRWPARDIPWFNSAKGDGTIEGNINHYKITLNTDSPWPLSTPSNWHAEATGNLDGLKLHSLRINALDGKATAKGQMSWSPQLNWKAEANVSNIDPSTLWPEWPGQLNGQLSSNGRMKNGQLIIEAYITQLEGKLRDHPVSLNSRLLWREDYLGISRLNFISGKSQLQLNGQLGEMLNLNWIVNSNDLAELYPQAKGQLQARGKLEGHASAPLIKATFNGKTLSYPGYEIAAIEGEMAVDLFRWQQIDIQLAARALAINDYKLKSLDINTNKKNINIQAASSRATADIVLSGEAQKTGWRGLIEKANIQSEYFDNWQLDSATPISIDETSLLVEQLCWHSSQQASLCASAKRDDEKWLSNVSMNNFPLNIFEQWLPSDLELDGTANGKAKAAFTLSEKFYQTLLADININLPPGKINYPMLSGENDLRKYKGGKIQLSLNTQGLKASSKLTMANGDRISGQLILPGAKPLATKHTEQTLQASAELDARDLRLIEHFIPEISDLQGELKLKLKVTGTLDRPIVNGNATITNGNMQIPGLGLNIEKINLNSQSDSSRKLGFRLDALSGGGKIVISGDILLDSKAGWPTEIHISGEDVEVANIPEAKLLMSPDVQVKIKNHSIDIKGKVHIPYGKLQPKDITTAATVSNDTIIIGGEHPVEEKWPINAAVRLTLGDRVHFYGFGFEGKLGGNVLLEDEPGQLTKATGEITIPEGTYRAYGQRLEVENGRILYTGSPLSNPGLDVRAVRKIDDITAGINVKGSLNQPQIEIFSSPTMSQTDALAYLLLGRPIESASSEDGDMMARAALAIGLTGGDRIARSLGDRFGLDEMRVESGNKGDQAALVVGRYLSPKIYVSYGVGLIERVNTLTLRYKISNKWEVKVESGNYQGADILYTIER